MSQYLLQTQAQLPTEGEERGERREGRGERGERGERREGREERREERREGRGEEGGEGRKELWGQRERRMDGNKNMGMSNVHIMHAPIVTHALYVWFFILSSLFSFSFCSLWCTMHVIVHVQYTCTCIVVQTDGPS